MYKCNFKAYEGDKDFIFISYAHKDAELVYPILDEMNAHGYRIWYDDGIIPGSEWPEYIAKHLSDCDTVVYFVTPDSAASENCRREVNFSLSKQKKFLSIFLKETELSPGMELQISSMQSLFKYKYDNEGQFYERLFCTPMISNCRREGGEDLDLLPGKDLTPEPEYVTDESGEIVYDEVKYVKPEKTPEQKAKTKRKVISILAVVIAVAAVVILIGGIIIGKIIIDNSPFGVKITDECSFARNEQYVYIMNETIGEKEMRQLGKLSKVEYLQFSGCTFEDGANLANLKAKDNITQLDLYNCSGLTDFSFLKKYKNLSTLVIRDCAEFDTLQDLPLDSIETLDIANTGVTNIDILANAPNLYSITCDNCAISSVNTDFDMSLSHLSMNNCGISDVSFVTDGENLKYVDLSNNPVTDITMMNLSDDWIDTLKLANTLIGSNSLEAISHYNDLTAIDLSGVPLEDASVIADMDELWEIRLSGCGLTSLEEGNFDNKLGQIETLDVSHNDISKLPRLEMTSTGYYDFSYNSITGVDGLYGEKTYWVSLDSNNIDWTENSDEFLACSIEFLSADYDDEMLLLSFPEGINLYLVGADKDNIEDLSGLISDGMIQGVTEEEIDSLKYDSFSSNKYMSY